MDVVRRSHKPSAMRYAPAAAIITIVAGLGAWSVPALLHPVASLPAIDRGTIVTDVVRRGSLVRSVHAAGQLVPDRVQVVAAATDGIVVDLPVRAGTRVAAGETIAVLRNPDLDAAIVDAAAQLTAAQAESRSAQQAGVAGRLDAQAALRTAMAEAARAQEEARADRALHAAGLIGDLVYRSALIRADETRDIVAIDRRKIAVTASQTEASTATAQAKVAQVAAQVGARRAQAQTLIVRAGSAGVVQSVAVDRGQRVPTGTELARIARVQDLKAVLQVPEGDLHGIEPGLPVRLEASGERPTRGRVARIAPAAQNGSVAVDVALESGAPGARPDQNVDGTIELARIPTTLSIARPANAADDTRVDLYRLSADGRHALRTAVRLGAGSLDRIAVTAGLAAGETVIVSDTSAYAAPELRLAP